jgi:hypothetical protein
MTLAGIGAGLVLLALLIGREVSAVRSPALIRFDRWSTWALALTFVVAAVVVLPRLVELLT